MSSAASNNTTTKEIRRLCINPNRLWLITCEKEWDVAWSSVATEVATSKVLGLDCEWKSYPNRCPVALLQLATASGHVLLVRLFMMENIPMSLQVILADKSVLKIGVQIQDDAKKLYTDYGLLVLGWIDLRYLARRTNTIQQYHGNGLKALTKLVLGVELDKNEYTARSNWEKEKLSLKQLTYAAADALVGVFIFIHLIRLKRPNLSPSSQQFTTFAMSMCQGLVEMGFKHNSSQNKQCKPTTTSATLTKPISRSYKPRKAPLYQNCKLLAPDDQLLSTCDEKKAQWYVDKGLADQVSKQPLVVKLRFEPSGRPRTEENYYTQEKLNICVVCGVSDSYIRKNIVPHEYRKYFPPMLKEHRSHDVLLVCLPCHQRSNLHDTTIKLRLADCCKAPMGTERGIKYRNDYRLSQVVSAAKALSNPKAKLPEARRDELMQLIQDYYGVSVVDSCVIQKALSIDTRVPNSDYIPHGLKVVEHMMKTEGLVQFEKMWRTNFISTMKPKFLPALWSVEHKHDDIADFANELQDCLVDEDGDNVEQQC